MFKVEVWEYERGWGSRLDSTKEFLTKELADAFVKEFNKDNNLDIVPDWYMVAIPRY